MSLGGTLQALTRWQAIEEARELRVEVERLRAELRDAVERQREACALSLCPIAPHSSCGDIQCPAAHVWLTPLVVETP